jgi:hypothetical protein
MSLADLLNAPTEIELDGKVWKLREPTLLEQATFQRHLETRAREAAGRATDIPDEDRRQLLRDVNADIAAGVYDFGGPVCVQALQTPTGLAKLIHIILRDQGCNEDIARKLVDRQLKEIVATLVGDRLDDEEKKRLLVNLGLPPTWSSSLRTPHSESPKANSNDSAPDSSKSSTP